MTARVALARVTERLARRLERRRPVLGLAVRAHHAVVAADAEVVLGRHAAGEVERPTLDEEAAAEWEEADLPAPVLETHHASLGADDRTAVAVGGEFHDQVVHRLDDGGGDRLLALPVTAEDVFNFVHRRLDKLIYIFVG